MPSGVHSNHARGSRHPRWNNRMISTEGYMLVRVGKDHPLANPEGYAYEHLLVWAAAGRELPKADELLHHIDEDKTNNRLSNLELMTRAEHARLHVVDRVRESNGRFVGERRAA